MLARRSCNRKCLLTITQHLIFFSYAPHLPQLNLPFHSARAHRRRSYQTKPSKIAGSPFVSTSSSPADERPPLPLCRVTAPVPLMHLFGTLPPTMDLLGYPRDPEDPEVTKNLQRQEAESFAGLIPFLDTGAPGETHPVSEPPLFVSARAGSGRRVLKMILRKGVPSRLRPVVWTMCTESVLLKLSSAESRHYYASLLAGDPVAAESEIAKDVARTAPSHPFINDGPGRLVLTRVLTAFARKNRRLGYCQGLNEVALRLLLVGYSEECAFLMLIHLVDKVLPARFYDSSLFGLRVDIEVLSELVRLRLPALHSRLQALHVPIQMLCGVDWFACLFATCGIPAASVLRIWDVLFSEGSKVLFRIALGILSLADADGVFDYPDFGRISQRLAAFLPTLDDGDRLIEAAFEHLKDFPMFTIEELRETIRYRLVVEDRVKQK